MAIGVLALQGDWLAHKKALRDVGVEAVPVRTTADLEGVEGLVLPGGESTAMIQLMKAEGLDAPLKARIRRGMPVLGICAGLILLATGTEPAQPSLAVIDVDVVRNAHGRQVHSKVTTIEVRGDFGKPGEMEAVFIRAPRITRTGDDVQVLGRSDSEPVLIRQGRVLAAAFHPELTADRRVHRVFCEMAQRLGEQ